MVIYFGDAVTSSFPGGKETHSSMDSAEILFNAFGDEELKKIEDD
jgi:hypothetical protein